MSSILWISPVGRADGETDAVREILGAIKRPDTEVEVTTLDRGPHHVEYRYYESLTTPDVLHRVKRAEREGFDAVVIGCFYDLGLDEARELTDSLVVAGPCESATHLASTMGDTFSIIVGRRKWIPQMRHRVARYGFADRLASFKAIDMGVLDFQCDHDLTRERLLAAGREAVEEDGAEVVILGCTAEYGFYEEMQDELGVPVLEAVTAPFKFAELQVELAELGWSHSKIGGYESPPTAEILEWGIPADYHGGDVWDDE